MGARSDRLTDALPRSVILVLFKTFGSKFVSGAPQLSEVADFASEIPPERLISITFTPGHIGGVGEIVVWYWGDPDRCPKCEYDLTGNTSGQCPECGTRV